VLGIGERLGLLGNTPVERAAARQWIQYRITRLRFRLLSEIDKRQLEEILQVSIHIQSILLLVYVFIQELNDYLSDKTYFVGAQFGIADLVIYYSTALYQYLVSSSHTHCAAISPIHSR